MSWPTVITKLAEIGLDDHAPKLKELGYDSMDAFDASDKAALEKIADELNLLPGHKAKFVKKFSEPSDTPTIAMPVGTPQPPASPANIVINVANNNNLQAGGGNDNETKIPATWLVGTWNGEFELEGCCCSDTPEIKAVGADAFDIKLGDEKATFTRMGHTNNFNPVGEPNLDTFSCCCGTTINKDDLKLMVLIDENNIRAGSDLQLGKTPPTDFRNGNATAETGSPPVPQTQAMGR